MSLHVLADHMASKGRNGDSMLVHMTPGEVAGLHALALKHGGELTINPDTGLPEASFLKSLLPMLAGAALNFFVPGLGAAVGGAFGVGAAAGTGIAVGGLTTLATGSLSRGLMAGMGAYGGAGLTDSLMNAGSAGLTAEAATAAGTQATEQGVSEAAKAQAIDEAARAQGFNEAVGKTATSDILSKGASSAMNAPGAFLKDNFKYLGAAAAPIMADMMVPTTTKMPAATDTGYIRQKVYDPGTQTYRSLTPVKANEWKDKSFSDIYRGYNGGGIVALAGGGMQHYEEGGGVVNNEGAAAPNYDQVIADAYATIGRSGLGEGTSQIDQGGYNHFLNMLQTGQVAPESFNDVFQGAVTRYIADNPNDRYTQYVNEYRGNQADTGGGGVTNLATTGGGAATAADTSGIATLNNTAGTNLAAFSNDYTGANINDYIANNRLDAAGIQAAGLQFNVDPAQIVAAQNAQNIVTNVYRNVLGRDPDPAGLSWWTNQIMNGDRTGAEMYESFKESAKSLLGTGGTKELFKDLSLADATKDYGGYQSADKRTIADEWVRNTLGREVTDADRQTQWYKDASDSSKMKTVGIAEDIYSKFKNFA